MRFFSASVENTSRKVAFHDETMEVMFVQLFGSEIKSFKRSSAFYFIFFSFYSQRILTVIFLNFVLL